MNEEQQLEYLDKWCERLKTATETKDLRTVSKMTDNLQSRDADSVIQMAANAFWEDTLVKVVRALKLVESLDARKIAQLLILHNRRISHVISEHCIDIIDIIEQMIQLGLPVHDELDVAYGRTALSLAVFEGDSHLRLVELLLDNGADPNWTESNGETALISCVSTSDSCPEILRLLISRGVNVDSSVLLSAIHYNQSREVIQLLMDEGSDLKACGDRSFADLYNGESHLRQEQVDYLLDLGIDPNIRGLYGENILYLAFEKASLEYLRYLVLVGNIAVATKDAVPLQGMYRPLSNVYDLREENMSQQEYEAVASKVRFCLLRGACVNYGGRIVEEPEYYVLMTEMRDDKWLDLRLEQIALREFMDRPVDKLMTKIFYCHKICASYIAACKHELVALMDTLLYDNVTLFDVLTDSDEKMIRRMRNEKLLAAFREFRELQMFPIYMASLSERIDQFLYLSGIRQKALEALCLVLGLDDGVIVQEILKNFSNRDLFKLSQFKRE